MRANPMLMTVFGNPGRPGTHSAFDHVIVNILVRRGFRMDSAAKAVRLWRTGRQKELHPRTRAQIKSAAQEAVSGWKRNGRRAKKAPARRYRPNPFVLIDSRTLKIIRNWKGSMMDRKPWEWAQEAARRLGRDVFVVAHPYVPQGFKAGVEVSKMFFAGGPFQVVSADGRSRAGSWDDLSSPNPSMGAALVGGMAGAMVTNFLSNPARRTLREDAIDKAISQAWARLASGVQVPILDIPRIFRDIKLEVAGGASLEQAVIAVAGRYRVNSNPLTREEAADVLRSARRDLQFAEQPFRGKADEEARRFYAGRAVGKAWAAKIHGPEREEHFGAEVVFRRGYRRGMQGNPGPGKRRVTMPIARFAKIVKAQRDPALWRDFVAKCKGYHAWSHGTWPTKVVVEAIRKPGVSGIWIAYGMGREPESTYIMPRGAKRKGAWKHPWTRMPELRGDPEAGLILTKLGKGNRLTDFLHG